MPKTTPETELTPAEFRRRVFKHLQKAIVSIPKRVPKDVCDPCVRPMMDQLQALDELLYGLGYEERCKEDEERSRERKVAAKAKRPDLEEILGRLDERAQKLSELVASDGMQARLVGSMQAMLFISAVVQLLETLPAIAYTEAMIPPGFTAREDATVMGILDLVRQRVTDGAQAPRQPHWKCSECGSAAVQNERGWFACPRCDR
jgi:hypothetical protein